MLGHFLTFHWVRGNGWNSYKYGSTSENIPHFGRELRSPPSYHNLVCPDSIMPITSTSSQQTDSSTDQQTCRYYWGLNSASQSFTDEHPAHRLEMRSFDYVKRLVNLSLQLTSSTTAGTGPVSSHNEVGHLPGSVQFPSSITIPEEWYDLSAFISGTDATAEGSVRDGAQTIVREMNTEMTAQYDVECRLRGAIPKLWTDLNSGNLTKEQLATLLDQLFDAAWPTLTRIIKDRCIKESPANERWSKWLEESRPQKMQDWKTAQAGFPPWETIIYQRVVRLGRRSEYAKESWICSWLIMAMIWDECEKQEILQAYTSESGVKWVSSMQVLFTDALKLGRETGMLLQY